jgi:hypothetical protein
MNGGLLWLAVNLRPPKHSYIGLSGGRFPGPVVGDLVFYGYASHEVERLGLALS